MIIKEANLDDADEILDIWEDFMDEHTIIVTNENPELKEYLEFDPNRRNIYRKFLESHMKSQDGAVFIAEDNGKIAGYVMIYIKDEIPVFKNKKIGYCSDLFIKKSHRNKSISSKLKNKVMEWFEHKGIKVISLATFYDNKNARAIYNKWGFFDYKVEMRRKI